jgi:hypothetical protein
MADQRINREVLLQTIKVGQNLAEKHAQQILETENYSQDDISAWLQNRQLVTFLATIFSAWGLQEKLEAVEQKIIEAGLEDVSQFTAINTFTLIQSRRDSAMTLLTSVSNSGIPISQTDYIELEGLADTQYDKECLALLEFLEDYEIPVSTFIKYIASQNVDMKAVQDAENVRIQTQETLKVLLRIETELEKNIKYLCAQAKEFLNQKPQSRLLNQIPEFKETIERLNCFYNLFIKQEPINIHFKNKYGHSTDQIEVVINSTDENKALILKIFGVETFEEIAIKVMDAYYSFMPEDGSYQSGLLNLDKFLSETNGSYLGLTNQQRQDLIQVFKERQQSRISVIEEKINKFKSKDNDANRSFGVGIVNQLNNLGMEIKDPRYIELLEKLNQTLSEAHHRSPLDRMLNKNHFIPLEHYNVSYVDKFINRFT